MTPAEARAAIAELLRRKAAMDAAKAYRWAPHDPTPKQAEFLDLLVLEALFGGAAGGGKSDALLMAALQYVYESSYAALILRRTYKDLALPGAIMDRSHDWLRGSAARWNDDEKTWRFPSGATITFGYLEAEKDKYRYQSAEFQFIAFDELTQFSETQYTYMLSRLRRKAGSKVPVRMRSASNPGGIGHDWVKRRFVDRDTHGQRVFVPAKLVDNPHVDQEEYDKALSLLDTTTRMQLRDGLWVRDTGGLVYKYNPDVNLVTALPERHDWEYVWVLDFGGSPNSSTEAVDILAFSRANRDVYLVESDKHPTETTKEIGERYRRDCARYGGFVATLGDQGGLGAKFITELQQREAMPIKHVEKKDKPGFRRLMNDDMKAGRFKVVDGSNDAWIDEANTLTLNDKGTDCEEGQPDHATDAGLYGWREAKHWLAKDPEPKPVPGTKEAIDAEAKDYEKAIREKVERPQADAWWEKGMQ